MAAGHRACHLTSTATRAAPTVPGVPYTADGACRLAGALHDVDEHVEHPLTVWWWDVSSGQERRGTLYGWRAGDGERFALIVTRGAWDACRPGGDCVRWVPEHFTRVRNE